MGRKMRKSILYVIAALVLVLAGSAVQSEAGVSVNIGINLPAIRFAAPPEVVVIPGTYIYVVPDSDVDIFFYQGYWWRPYKGQWYRSRDYKGSWRYIDSLSIPPGLRKLPQDYRHRLSPGYRRIPHRDVQRNWKRWEKEKYWDRKSERHRDERRDHYRDSRDDQGYRGHGDQDRKGRDSEDHGKQRKKH